MNREFRIVMEEEVALCIREVIKDWEKNCVELGFEPDERFNRVVEQIEQERERLFGNTEG